MKNTDESERQSLIRSLSTTLAAHPDGFHREELVRFILRHSSGGQQFLGVISEDLEAVYFDPIFCCVYHLPVSRSGLHPTETTLDWRFVADPLSWVDDNRHRLTWCHPRYRNTDYRDRGYWRYHVSHGNDTH